MKITKSQLKQIIKEELIKEISRKERRLAHQKRESERKANKEKLQAQAQYLNTLGCDVDSFAVYMRPSTRPGTHEYQIKAHHFDDESIGKCKARGATLEIDDEGWVTITGIDRTRADYRNKLDVNMRRVFDRIVGEIDGDINVEDFEEAYSQVARWSTKADPVTVKSAYDQLQANQPLR